MKEKRKYKPPKCGDCGCSDQAGIPCGAPGIDFTFNKKGSLAFVMVRCDCDNPFHEEL